MTTTISNKRRRIEDTIECFKSTFTIDFHNFSLCATDICKYNYSKWDDFIKCKDNIEYINNLSRDTNIPLNKLIFYKNDSETLELKLWTYFEIALKLAQWSINDDNVDNFNGRTVNAFQIYMICYSAKKQIISSINK